MLSQRRPRRAASASLTQRGLSRISVAMSGRGHRGKRPRGDGSRGPRTSSSTGRPHGALESMLGAITSSDLAPHSFGIWPLLLLAVLAQQGHLPSWILPWLLLLVSIGRAAAVFMVAFLPSVFCLIHRLRCLLCHRVVALVIATELFLLRCMATPVPMPTPSPQPTPTPMPTPTPTLAPTSTLAPSLQLQSSSVTTPAGMAHHHGRTCARARRHLRCHHDQLCALQKASTVVYSAQEGGELPLQALREPEN